MKHTVIKFLLALFIGSFGFAYGQETKRADSTLVNGKGSLETNNNTKVIQSIQNDNRETQSSGIIKTEPVILRKDEEKTSVKPN